MENIEINNLKEWSILDDLHNKIPPRIQKGLFSHNVNFTCIDVVSEFIAIGTDVGIVFWYNRKNGNIQKLRGETSKDITCVKIVSSVEFMVAAGYSSGEISVFQIQKEHPPDLNLDPLTKPKPTERYTIRNLHQSNISCLEWSKNGMKLFSGDKQGVIILTEFDYQTHISKSFEILNEAYDIIQISFIQPWLLISTKYRAIICEKDKTGKWKVSQIGKKDRKILSDFGACFIGSQRKWSLLCARPGFRFWISDTKGNVSQTLLFKDAMVKPTLEVPLLNPGRLPIRLPMNFGKLYNYQSKYILTWNENMVHILNINDVIVEASIKRLRSIIDLAICNSDIYIIEGPRSIIRISTNIDISNFNTNTVIFNPMLANLSNSNSVDIIEHTPTLDIDEEAITNAEECFELPPIEELKDISFLECDKNNPQTTEDRLYLDHSRKVEVYDKINSIQYDDSILFKSGILNKKHFGTEKKSKSSKKNKKGENNHGIVEIGKQILTDDVKDSMHNESLNKENGVLMTRPCVLKSSFCEHFNFEPDLRSPDTINKEISVKEKRLHETLKIEPVSLEKLDTPMKTPDKIIIPNWINSFENQNSSDEINSLKKIHFINDINYQNLTNNHYEENMNNLSDDLKNIMIKSNLNATTSKEITPPEPDPNKIPDYLNIPSLWNITIIKPDKSDDSSEDLNNETITKNNEAQSEGSDWEIL